MKYCLLLVVALGLPGKLVAGDIYKCLGSNGKYTFTDRECPKTALEAELAYKGKSLLAQVKAAAPGNSQLEAMEQQGEDYLIQYAFLSNEELTEFMRNLAQIGPMGPSLLKVVMPIDGIPGKAEILLSNKKGLLDSDNRNSD